MNVFFLSWRCCETDEEEEEEEEEKKFNLKSRLLERVEGPCAAPAFAMFGPSRAGSILAGTAESLVIV